MTQMSYFVFTKNTSAVIALFKKPTKMAWIVQHDNVVIILLIIPLFINEPKISRNGAFPVIAFHFVKITTARRAYGA